MYISIIPQYLFYIYLCLFHHVQSIGNSHDECLFCVYETKMCHKKKTSSLYHFYLCLSNNKNLRICQETLMMLPRTKFFLYKSLSPGWRPVASHPTWTLKIGLPYDAITIFNMCINILYIQTHLRVNNVYIYII